MTLNPKSRITIESSKHDRTHEVNEWTPIPSQYIPIIVAYVDDKYGGKGTRPVSPVPTWYDSSQRTISTKILIYCQHYGVTSVEGRFSIECIDEDEGNLDITNLRLVESAGPLHRRGDRAHPSPHTEEYGGYQQ